MSIFNNSRLTNETFKLDIERMRRGWYSDKYFENIGRMLTALASEKYLYAGQHHNLPPNLSPDNIAVGDIEVEMQWFTRRIGSTIVVGVDKTLAMLRHCTGYWEGETFVDTSDKLEVGGPRWDSGEIRRQSAERWAGHQSTRTLPRFRPARNAIAGRVDAFESRCYQRLRNSNCRAWQARVVLPRAV
ncbi:MAG: hypothetical protein U0V48_13960 [Anaerolineales bacterium]